MFCFKSEIHKKKISCAVMTLSLSLWAGRGGGGVCGEDVAPPHLRD